MKINEIIERIRAYHPQIDDERSCDGYKYGDPQQECTGIAIAIAPTAEVVRKAGEAGCNLLFVHEPSFYTSRDTASDGRKEKNEVLAAKRELLDRYHMVIWRDHDRMHMHEPDSIFTGVIRELGWEECRLAGEGLSPIDRIFDIPEMTVSEMREFLVERLGLNGLRYVGNPNARIRRVAIVGHLTPGFFDTEDKEYSERLMEQMEELDIHALLPLEVVEWTLLSYIRDAEYFGKNRVVFQTGHFCMEDLGMRYAQTWLKEVVGQEVPMTYIAAGDIYHYQPQAGRV